MKKNNIVLASLVLLIGFSVPVFSETTTYIGKAILSGGDKPLAFLVEEMNVIVYVESDGRHISAIDTSGKILWTKDPVIDEGLKEYRVKEPKIVRLGKPLEWMKPYAKRLDKKNLPIRQIQYGFQKTEPNHLIS